MKRKDLIDTSKRMVVEYYNRYVQNVETDMSDTDISVDNVILIEENNISDNTTHLILKVNCDAWLLYNIIYHEKENRIESYISLS